jgi:hypothetical protein
VAWFKSRRIELYGVNRNPTQDTWTASPKAYAKLYIDDAALGCPLKYPRDARPFVNWRRVRTMLREREILPPLKASK